MKSFSAFFILFCFIFAPFLRFESITIYFPYLMLLGMALLGGWVCIKEPEVFKTGRMLTLSLLALFIYGVCVSLYQGIFDKEFYLQVVRGLLLLPAGVGVVVLYARVFGDKAVDTVLWHLFLSGVVHSVIMLLAFSLEPVSEFLYSYIPLSEKGMKFVELRIRAPGLTSAGGDILSGLHAVLVTIGLYITIKNWQALGGLKRAGVGLGCYLLLASLSLSARTGYVVVLALLPCLFIALAWHSGRRYQLSSLVKGFFAFLLFAIFAAGSFSSLLNFFGEERAYKRSAEVVRNYQETGEAKMASVDALKDMYFVSADSWAVLFGTGNLGRSDPLSLLPSDVGYVRALHGFGIAGSILMYVPFLLIGLDLLRKPSIAPAQIVLGMCAGAILVMNLKVFYFWGLRDIFKIFVIMIFLSNVQQFLKFTNQNKMKLSNLK